MDNKKLLFAVNDGGAAKAVNLIFCNIESKKCKERIINVMKNTNNKVLSVFTQCYYKDGQKIPENPKINKPEPNIKYSELI